MMRRLVLATVVPLLLVAGCGEETPVASDAGDDSSPSVTASESPSESPSESSSSAPVEQEPACDDIWIDQETLPSGYKGCYQDGEMVRAEGRYCEFGKKLFTHDDRFYAVKGGRIAEAKEPFLDDPGYQDVLAKCSG